MTARCRRPAARIGLALAALTFPLHMACNPALISTIGGDSVVATDPPNGYIVVLLMNQTTGPVAAVVDITKEDGTLKRWNISTGPFGSFSLLQDCDVERIQVVEYTYNTGGTATTIPSNLGPLISQQSFYCGSVLAITATGNPPTFSVQVY